MAEDCSVYFPAAGLIARIDWLQGFMKRHKNLTLRKHENTRLFSATAFNKTNVMEFFDNYELALKSWKFTADRVCNIDETGDVQSYSLQHCCSDWVETGWTSCL
jgi:hypothetical protein